MSTTINSNGNFTVKVGDDTQPSMEINGSGDLKLSNPSRTSSGRALVPNVDGELVINYNQDFQGGVQINGLKKLLNLPAAPAGINTFDVVIDANGNVYKKD